MAFDLCLFSHEVVEMQGTYVNELTLLIQSFILSSKHFQQILQPLLWIIPNPKKFFEEIYKLVQVQFNSVTACSLNNSDLFLTDKHGKTLLITKACICCTRKYSFQATESELSMQVTGFWRQISSALYIIYIDEI